VAFESLITELIKGFARIANGGSAEEIEEHEESVGCLAGVEGFLQTIVGDC